MIDERILELPLFMGMSPAELESLHEDGAFAVRTVSKGTTIALEGTRCEGLHIIIEGTTLCVTMSNGKAYSMEENIQSPTVIELDRLFGKQQRYGSAWVASTPCSILTVSKAHVLKLMDISMVFRINFLNAVTAHSQRISDSLWHQQYDDIPHRVIRFIKDHCQYPAGSKVLRIKMKTLARELGCSRLEVSEALHLLQDKELIRLRRSAIEVPMMQLLLKYQ